MIKETSYSPSDRLFNQIKILIVTSVLAEKKALEEGLGKIENVDIEVVGVGPICAAVETTKLLYKKKYELVICAGIAGGFAKHTSIGTLVISDRVISADLGAQSPEGFLSLNELNLGKTYFPVTSPIAETVKSILKNGMDEVVIGPILTLSTVTGTDKTTKELSDRYPYAVAEAMEGFGVATAANAFSIPFIELRAISNYIGPRDKSKWRFHEAFSQLKKAGYLLRQTKQ
ncbi:futalosine hydrolase [Shimazuella kribbensis]|uniref:futalosine hydrolase n=1 Tax=Shimazuella kribbensis TaxID=139808 RepID=UPI0003F87CC4|nr:futalosine hydrolase [Shimazuella kribbensis]